MTNLLNKKLSQTVGGGSAAVAVIINDAKVLLGLRQYSQEKGGASVWTVPGGSVDSDEILEIAVRRETQEEAAIDDLAFVDYLGEVVADNRDPLHVFHCETNQEPKLAEPKKFKEWRWFSAVDFANGKPTNFINESLRNRILDYCKNNGII